MTPEVFQAELNIRDEHITAARADTKQRIAASTALSKLPESTKELIYLMMMTNYSIGRLDRQKEISGVP